MSYSKQYVKLSCVMWTSKMSYRKQCVYVKLSYVVWSNKISYSKQYVYVKLSYVVWSSKMSYSKQYVYVKLSYVMWLSKMSYSKQYVYVKLSYVGDFNIYFEIADDPETLPLKEILDNFGLKQLIDFPTHRCGHTLDLIIVDKDDSVMSRVHTDHSLWSDHVAIKSNLDVVRPTATKKTISFRKFRDLNVEAFSDDLSSSLLCTAPNESLNELTAQYNNVLSDFVNLHAPETEKTITLRPHAPSMCIRQRKP